MADTLPMTIVRLRRRSIGLEARREFDLASGRGPGARAAATGEPHLEIESEQKDLTFAEAGRVSADADVAAVVPSVPFRLPKPVPASLAVAGDGTSGAGAAAGAGGVGASWGIAAVGADQAPPEAGGNVVVAVLDSGLTLDDTGKPRHPAFAGLTVKYENFTKELDDPIGHGTHTAATIFGRDVGGVRIGIARGVRKALIGKILSRSDVCDTDTILRAMYWALSEGAHVINMSLGVDFVGYHDYLVNERKFPNPKATSIALAGYRLNIRLFDRLSMLLGVDDRGFAGSFVVAAAGNESLRPDYTITTAPPAAGERFFAVGAVDRSHAVAAFSNDDVDIVGPGVDILSAGRDLGLRLDSGTSMAAPHVAGVATLYADEMIRAGAFGAAALERKLRETAKPTGGSPRDVGSGLVQWVKPR